MKLCAIFLSCVLSFVLPTAHAQTSPRQQPKRAAGKPRPKVQPRQQPPPPPADSNFQEEMNDAEAGAAVQPPTRRYVAPPPAETTHELGDITFHTPNSRFKFDVTYSNTSAKTELRSNSFLLSTVKTNPQILGATAEYGLFHHFVVGFGWDYQLAGNEDTTLPSGTSSRTQQLGYKDPVIYGAYQILDQDDGPMNLIVKLGYSPKMGNAKVGTTTSNGNALRGSDEFSLSAVLGKKFYLGELAATLRFNSIGSTSKENAASSALQGSSDGITRLGVELGGRTGFWILHPGLAVKLNSTSSFADTSTNGTKTNYPQNSVFSFVGSLDMDLVRDVCIVGATYEVVPSYTSDATVTNSTVNMKTDSSTIGAKLSFLF